MRDDLLILARYEACLWLGNHPEIPWATIDVEDEKIRVMLGTRTTHLIVEIRGSDIAPDNQYAVQEKLDRVLGWLGASAPGEDGSCS